MPGSSRRQSQRLDVFELVAFFGPRPSFRVRAPPMCMLLPTQLGHREHTGSDSLNWVRLTETMRFAGRSSRSPSIRTLDLRFAVGPCPLAPETRLPLSPLLVPPSLTF